MVVRKTGCGFATNALRKIKLLILSGDMVKSFGSLVQVSFMRYHTSTPCLSTS